MKTETKQVDCKDLFGKKFTINVVCQIAENRKEAEAGNEQAKGLGKDAIDKMAIAKFLTNQYDRARVKAEKEKATTQETALKAIPVDKLNEAAQLLGVDLKALLGL